MPPSEAAVSVLLPQQLFFMGDGRIPNSRYPALIYQAVPLGADDRARAFEELFAAHQWSPLWRSTVFDYHHYHSTAHEALGIVSGCARLQLGGDEGQEITVQAGDAVVLPAGTGHRCLEASEDFLVVGAYPHGQEDYDLHRDDPAEYVASQRRIMEVPLPMADPVSGAEGTLMQSWPHQE